MDNERSVLCLLISLISMILIGLFSGSRFSTSGRIAFDPGRYFEVKFGKKLDPTGLAKAEIFGGYEVLQVMVIYKDYEGI